MKYIVNFLVIKTVKFDAQVNVKNLTKVEDKRKIKFYKTDFCSLYSLFYFKS